MSSWLIREQYAAWKTECKEMVPVIGSEKFITAAIITDDGLPMIETSVNGNPPDEFGAKPSDDGSAHKRVIQWKLSLHQIGWLPYMVVIVLLILAWLMWFTHFSGYIYVFLFASNLGCSLFMLSAFLA